MAELKATYDFMLKRLKADKHADKIEEIKGKKEKALKDLQTEMDDLKKSKVA